MDDEEGCYRAPLLERWTPHGANVTRVNVPLITLINEALCLVEASMATNGNACAISITSVRARVTRLLSNSREFHRSSILIRSSVREKEEEIEKGRENLGRFDFWPIVNLKRSKNFEIVDSNVRSRKRREYENLNCYQFFAK